MKRYKANNVLNARPASTGEARGWWPPSTPGCDSRVSKLPEPQGCRVALRDDVGPAIIDALLRYVNDFGHGSATAIVEEGAYWLELQFREDLDIVEIQFSDLLAYQEIPRRRGR